jgi:hypothetical protein
MIQKQLFFIWIGNNLPIYTQNAIKWFKELNPDFKIDVVMDDGNNIENNKEVCVRNTYQHIYNVFKKDNKKDKYYHYLKGPLTNSKSPVKRQFMCYFSDILRLELLQTYGGIYVDTDTFPVRPFDEKLLSLNFFKSKSLGSKGYYYDIYFFGYNKLSDYNYEQKKFEEKFKNLDIKEYLIFNKELEYKEKFLNGTLTPNLLSNTKLYIQHYRTLLWGKNKYSTSKHLDEYFGTIYD